MNNKYMLEALAQAKTAFDVGEMPVGAVITKDKKLIAKAYNMRETNNSATAHAEILAIEQACKLLKNWRLTDCDIYVTLEPCPMCMGAIINARIKNLYFGAYDRNTGACGSMIDINNGGLNHTVTIYEGIMQEECEEILTQFFNKIR